MVLALIDQCFDIIKVEALVDDRIRISLDETEVKVLKHYHDEGTYEQSLKPTWCGTNC